MQSFKAVAEAVEGIPGCGVGVGGDLKNSDGGLRLFGAEKVVPKRVEAAFDAGGVTVLRVGSVCVQRCERLIVTVLHDGPQLAVRDLASDATSHLD